MITKKDLLIEGIPLTIYNENDGTKKPLLYFFHGFCSNRNKGIMGRGEILASKGYYVVAIDAYLHGERSIPRFDEKTQVEKYKDFFNIVMRTAQDAKYLYEKYFKFDEHVIPDKVYAYGVSMGASVAFYLATIFEPLQTFASIVGSPSFVEFYQYMKQMRGWDENDPYYLHNLQYYIGHDPLINYERLKDKNIFMGCGVDDYVVPYRFAEKLSTKLTGDHIVYKLYQTEHLSTPEMQEDAYRFLQEH